MGNLLSCFSWSLEAVSASWFEVPSFPVLDDALFNFGIGSQFSISPSFESVASLLQFHLTFLDNLGESLHCKALTTSAKSLFIR